MQSKHSAVALRSLRSNPTGTAMARPRIFISSTYYDLKHLRSSLDNFVASLGFDSVLSEKGDIAYASDSALDESCYREVSSVDVFVIVIGGRYGSEASSTDKRPSKDFFDRYDSITKKEYEAAAARNIPIYILIDANVYAEYQTFSRNKESKDVRYAHVDSVNVFHLIADILSKPKNNPLQTFVRFGDIENWLREQWAGLFRELLSRMSGQRQIESLASQVEDLRELNVTLRRYLEALMTKVVPEAPKLIAEEQVRLAEAHILERLQSNDWFQFVRRHTKRSAAAVRDALSAGATPDEFVMALKVSGSISDHLTELLRSSRAAIDDYNECRDILGKPPIIAPDDERRKPTAKARSKEGATPSPDPGARKARRKASRKR